MKSHNLARVGAALLLVSPLAGAQGAEPAPWPTPTAADTAMTCEQIGAEMTELTGSVADVALTAGERANRKRHNPTSIANTMTNQVLGMAVAGAGSGAVGALGNALSVIQQVKNEAENRESAVDQRAFAEMGSAGNLANLERLGMLNDLYQANKCEGAS